MKSLLLAVVALAPLAVAQTQCNSLTSQFPACASQCVTSAASAVGCTNTLDYHCQCTPASSSAIQSKALVCVGSNCSGGDIAKAIAAGSSICSCASANPALATS